MQTKISIEGAYSKVGNTFFHQSGTHKLVLAEREPKNNKPKQFFILKSCSQSVNFPANYNGKYVSGVYWVSQNTFSIDFEGTAYTCTIQDASLEIKANIREKGKVL